MFLTESSMYSYNNLGITDDPATLLEATLEAQEEYQRLTETMVVLEHKAIVTENASLLREAEDKFSEKVKESVKMLGQRIIAFLEKCRAKAQEIALRIAAPLIKKWANKKSTNFGKEGYSYKNNKKISIPSWYAKNGDKQDLDKVMFTSEDSLKKAATIAAGSNSNSEAIQKIVRDLKDTLHNTMAETESNIEKDDSELLKFYAEAAAKRLSMVKQTVIKLTRATQDTKKAVKNAELKSARENKDKDAIKDARAALVGLSRVSSLSMNAVFKIVGIDIKVLRHITSSKNSEKKS